MREVGITWYSTTKKCGNSEALEQKLLVRRYGCGILVGLFIQIMINARKSNWFVVNFGIKKLQVNGTLGTDSQLICCIMIIQVCTQL